MKASTFNAMLRFHPNKLMDLFVERFLIEFGSIKIQEIHNRVNTSQKVENYLLEVGYNLLRPTSKGILSLLNTLPYFIFAKGETLCIGSLFVLKEWDWRFNEKSKVLIDDEKIKVAADLIMYCYRIKFNKADSLFSRFFIDIKEIIIAEEKENVPKRLTFSINSVSIYKRGGVVEWKAVCDNGFNIKFLESEMDDCIDELDPDRGLLFAVKEGVKVGKEGRLIVPPKKSF